MRIIKLKNLISFILILLGIFTFQTSNAQWTPLGPAGNNLPTKISGHAPALGRAPNGVMYLAYLDVNSMISVRTFNNGVWSDVGTPSFVRTNSDVSIAVDGTGAPYIAYESSLSAITVQKFNGANWVTVGANISAMTYQLTLAIDGNGVLYVAYLDRSNTNQGTVQMFTNGSWTNLTPNGITGPNALAMCFALDYKGNLFVAYGDGTTGYGILNEYDKVQGKWTTVGNAPFYNQPISFLSLTLDAKGDPYLALLNTGGENSVYKFSFKTNNWTSLGSYGFGASKGIIGIAANGFPYIVCSKDVEYPKNNNYYCIVLTYDGVNWNTSGNSNEISYGDVISYEPLATLSDNNGNCYIAYPDGGNYDLISVKKINGTTWADLTGSISGNDFGFKPSIAINNLSVPYIFYSDNSHNKKGTLKQYSNGSWSSIGGDGFTAGAIDNPHLVFDPSGNPTVLFDDPISQNLTVMKNIQGTWNSIGIPAFVQGQMESLAVNAGGDPFIVFRGANGITVMSYYANAWNYIGNQGFSGGDIYNPDIIIDRSGFPIVAFTDYKNSQKISVMRWNGTSWNYVGSAGFTSTNAYDVTMKIDNNGVLYIACNGYVQKGSGTYVMKFSGSVSDGYSTGNWSSVGNSPMATSLGSTNLSLQFDNNQVPYISFVDASQENRMSVMKLFGSTWTYVGVEGLSFTPISSGTMAISNNKLFVSYSNDQLFAQTYDLNGPPNLNVVPISEPIKECNVKGATTSVAQQFKVSGSNLTADVMVTAPPNFQLSTDGNIFSNTVTLSQNGGTTNGVIYLRPLNNAPVGNYSGQLSISSGTLSQNVPVSANVYQGPAMNINGLNPVSTNATSFNLSFTVSGSPDYYNLYTGYRSMNGFNNMNGKLGSSPLTIPIPASPAGTYDFYIDLTNTSNGCKALGQFSLTVTSNYNLTGNILTETGKAVPNVTLTQSGGATGTTTTDASGNYAFSIAPGTSLTVTPTKNNDASPTNGINLGDILAVKGHIVGKSLLNSPYKIIAADVNNDGALNLGDILTIKRFVLGTINSFTGNTLWAFVDAKQTFGSTTPTAPFAYNSSLSYSNLSADQPSQNFIGVKLADVNEDGTPTKAIGGKELELYYDTLQVSSNSDVVRIPVKVKGFKDLLGLQFTLGYNADKFDFEGIASPKIPIEYNEQRDHKGQIAFLWVDDNIVANTIADNDRVFDLLLKKKSHFDKEDINIVEEARATPMAYDKDMKQVPVIKTSGLLVNKEDSKPYSGTDKILVSPNPGNGMLKVRISSATSKTVTMIISETSGKIILKREVKVLAGDNEFEMNINEDYQHSSGIYYLKTLGLDNPDVIKLVVNK